MNFGAAEIPDTMGLDAGVYVHRRNLPFELRASHPRIDAETGEVCFADSTKVPQGVEFVAVEMRLGNLALIAALREQIRTIFGSDSNSLLIDGVLYSGSHSGDVIPVADLGRLRDELAKLQNLTEGNRTAELSTFLDQFQQLVASAEYQQNPIVFI